jgi:hypothetical protein
MFEQRPELYNRARPECRVTTDSSLDEQSAVTASTQEAAGAEMLQGVCAPAAFGECASVAVRRKPRK